MDSRVDIDSKISALGSAIGTAFRWYYILIGVLAVSAVLFAVLCVRSVRMKKKGQKPKAVPRWISAVLIGLSLAIVLGITAILVFPI